MRLLLINPNTSKGATARIAAAAEKARWPGDKFTTLSPAMGPELIVTEADSRGAADAVVDTVESYQSLCDGIILASFGNTGAAQVQALRPDIPVIGIATAAFSVARVLGGPFAIATFGQGLVPGLMAQVKESRLEDQLTETLCLDVESFGDPGTVQDRYGDALLALCLKAASRGAHSIVVGGGPLAGLAGDLAKDCPIPLIDGTQAAINIIRAVLHRPCPSALRQ